MALTVGEADDFILDRRAVAGPFNGATTIRLRHVQVFTNDPVGLQVSVGQPARQMLFRDFGREKRKWGCLRVAVHRGEVAKVNASPVDPRRGAGFKAFQVKTEPLQALGQGYRGKQPPRGKVMPLPTEVYF